MIQAELDELFHRVNTHNGCEFLDAVCKLGGDIFHAFYGKDEVAEQEIERAVRFMKENGFTVLKNPEFYLRHDWEQEDEVNDRSWVVLPPEKIHE
jgi:hypothetical protein